MSKQAYRILDNGLETFPEFEASENEEFYRILESLGCCEEESILVITKDILEKAKKLAKKYETLETIFEIERLLNFSEEENIRYLCK